MNERARATLFLISILGFAAISAWAVHDLPPFGYYRGPYGDLLNQVAVYERHATDVVNAVTYDYRGFDTLGEEFILFASVTGVLLLLRKTGSEQEREHAEKIRRAEQDKPLLSEAVRVMTLGMVGMMVIFGLYISLHGQLTPGGGFQGGVILASAPLLVYLAGNLEAFKRITTSPLLKIAEAIGAGGYAVVGLIAFFAGAAFLTNVIPLYQTGSVFSAGTIAVISALVGLEVAGGFVLLMHTFLREVLEDEEEKDERR